MHVDISFNDVEVFKYSCMCFDFLIMQIYMVYAETPTITNLSSFYHETVLNTTSDSLTKIAVHYKARGIQILVQNYTDFHDKIQIFSQ